MLQASGESNSRNEPGNRAKKRKIGTMLHKIFRPIFWILFRTGFAIFGGLRTEGRENVPLTGGALITPNHVSDCDPVAVGVSMPRDAFTMAKEELFDMKMVGPIMRVLNGFPVKRYTADRNALRFAEDRLKEGEAVIIFPEGKLSEDGKLQPMLPGVILIAQRANVPIVPTIVFNTADLMPYGKLTPRFIKKSVIVRYGTPVTVAELKGSGKGGEALKQGAERLFAIMQALQEGKPYPPKPVDPPRTKRSESEPDSSDEVEQEAKGQDSDVQESNTDGAGQTEKADAATQ